MTDNALTVIDTTRLPADRADEFIEQWRHRAEIVSKAPGFRDARLHRALATDAQLPLVMVANWDSVAARDAALANPAFQTSAQSSRDYAEVQGSEYAVAAEYRSDATPAGRGITFVNAFELPAELVDEFLAHWRTRAELMSAAAGFRDNRLHRSTDPSARFQAVNVAHWDSADAWRAAGNNPAFQQRLAVAPTYATAHPELYEVVAEFAAAGR
ncbi:antibiotic biosynthesis monooxygenase family protein [Nocardia sp. CA-128927]|uniref:antibiotic biosynthesis monooxygenase family protein n=1 Tax=Nocardia sp. CA-128927 TaxID=3239975 RepID=UPI003D96C1CE